MVDVVDEVHSRSGEIFGSPRRDIAMFNGDGDLEPHDGIEFDTHEAAYSFYQEYAKSMGFTTSIKNSRRSKKTKEFIDAKFACSRYGITPESDSGSSRRPSVRKTDCKACMHVKRKPDGKWIVHDFIKEHNHELLPALAYHFRIHKNVKLAEKNNIDILHAVSERTRKMYVDMSRRAGGCQNFESPKSELSCQFERGRGLELDEGDAQIILEYFKHIQKEDPNFFYMIDLNEEQCLRNLFWVDAKSRSNYVSFSDVISFDTAYIKSNDKLPFAPFVGVNHHSQPMLLGCALVADESKSTYVWLMKTWLRAMGGQAPKVIIADQENGLKAAIEEVLPNTRHCFSLSHVLERIPENLASVIKQYDNFLPKFNKCIFRSWTDEKFDMRWWKMVTRFELQDDVWVRALYEDRQKWVPTYMEGTFLAGMSTPQRSESVNSFFDKYIHRKITLKEFVKQYGSILQNGYEEESIADFDTLHKQPALRSPSPWEKQMSRIYTHAIFKKFQVEVVGAAGVQPKRDVDGKLTKYVVSEDGTTMKHIIQDCEKDEDFMVSWNEMKSEVSCSCRMFEYKGYLCRHALYVLQISGLSSIPPQYILKRWAKDGKSREHVAEGHERVQTRAQRYNDLCRRAIELSEEGSLSEESYRLVLRVLVDALKNCVNLNNSNYGAESSDINHGIREAEDNQGSVAAKSSRTKNTSRKRKVQSEPDVMLVDPQDNLQQMENLTTEAVNLTGYYGTQQNVQGLLNLMERPHDGYYVPQQSIQGLGHLNTMAPSQEGFFSSQQSIHGLGHLEFRPPSAFGYTLQEAPPLRSSQLHESTSRNP